jgi:hypothetical protein
MILLSLTFAVAGDAQAAPPTPKAACIDPCGCGCVKTGSCMCKNCNEHTADPNYKPAAKAAKADPYGVGYDSFYRMLVNGTVGSLGGYLAVGVPNPWDQSYMIHCSVPSGFKGIPDGVYHCFLSYGVPSMEPAPKPLPAKATAAAPALTAGGCPGGVCPAPPRAKRGLFGWR